jgi:hypothetical protein
MSRIVVFIFLSIFVAEFAKSDSETNKLESDFDIPYNGQICKRCDSPSEPNDYRQTLEDLTTEDLSKLNSDIINKIEGFKILEFELKKYYGDQISQLVFESLKMVLSILQHHRIFPLEKINLLVKKSFFQKS